MENIRGMGQALWYEILLALRFTTNRLRVTGEVIQLHALGHNILVVNTVKAARELLEKKSLYFSDRPPVPVLSL